MAESVTTKAVGLWLQGSDLAAPEGALTVAENAVIGEDNLIEPRRGFGPLAPLTASQILALYGAGGKGLYYSTSDDVLRYFNGDATITALGTYGYPYRIAPSPWHGSFSHKGYTFFISDPGYLYRYLPGDAVAYRAGPPPGLDMQATISASSGSAIKGSAQVAYRHLWVQIVGSRKIEGAPSPPVVVTNNSGSEQAIDLTITVPQGFGITASTHLLRVYRTKSSVSNATAPGDEMQLCLEQAAPASGQTVTVTDITADALLGASLYTNESQSGITSANCGPPQAVCMAMFKGCAFYGAVWEAPSADLVVLGTGAGSLNVGTTVTISGNAVYTGAAAENIGARQFKVFTGGSPSADVASTVESLVRVINRDTDAGTHHGYAVAIESSAGFANQIRVTSRTAEPIWFSSVPAGCRVPQGAGAYDGGSKPTRLYWSKPDQPEAVPLTQFQDVGDTDAILALKATRDTLFILKGDEGVYRVTGTWPNFSIEPFDRNTKLVAPKTAVALDNQVFMLTEQGVAAVNDNGVELISRAVEPELWKLLTGDATTPGQRQTTITTAFGIGYESARLYLLFTQTALDDAIATQVWCYNLITQGWTHWTVSASHGLVNDSDDRLYLVTGSALNRERKDMARTDYADSHFAQTVVASTSDTIALPDVSGVAVGDMVFQVEGGEGTDRGLVVSIAGSVLTLDRQRAWADRLGVATVFKAFPYTVEWVPKFAPLGKIHRFIEAAIQFRRLYCATAAISFATDMDTALESITVTPGWLGVEQEHAVPLVTVPRNKTHGALLRVRYAQTQAWSPASIQALSVTYTPGVATARPRTAGAPSGDVLDAVPLY